MIPARRQNCIIAAVSCTNIEQVSMMHIYSAILMQRKDNKSGESVKDNYAYRNQLSNEGDIMERQTQQN